MKMRIYRTEREVMIAACDAELIGKCFREGELQLDVTSFYDGATVDKIELIRHLRLATIGNFVGEKVVEIAIEQGLVDENHVIRIDGIPHAQTVLM
jgi:hypothetical protein